MNQTNQMSFLGFEAESSEDAIKPVKASTRKAKGAQAVTAPGLSPEVQVQALPEVMNISVTPAHETEAMAQALAQHPDFRVLRRLQPRTDYGPLKGQATQRVIVLDTETTGLDARQEKVIELAMLSVLVDTATGQPIGPVTLYESFEDPGKPIPPQITEITGIDDSMVQGQRIDDAAVTQLVEQADLIVAHNAGFDRPFV